MYRKRQREEETLQDKISILEQENAVLRSKVSELEYKLSNVHNNLIHNYGGIENIVRFYLQISLFVMVDVNIIF